MSVDTVVGNATVGVKTGSVSAGMVVAVNCGDAGWLVVDRLNGTEHATTHRIDLTQIFSMQVAA